MKIDIEKVKRGDTVTVTVTGKVTNVDEDDHSFLLEWESPSRTQRQWFFESEAWDIDRAAPPLPETVGSAIRLAESNVVVVKYREAGELVDPDDATTWWVVGPHTRYMTPAAIRREAYEILHAA